MQCKYSHIQAQPLPHPPYTHVKYESVRSEEALCSLLRVSFCFACCQSAKKTPGVVVVIMSLKLERNVAPLGDLLIRDFATPPPL